MLLHLFFKGEKCYFSFTDLGILIHLWSAALEFAAKLC